MNRWIKLVVGVVATAVAALMIQYWPYNFEPLIEPEYSLKWTDEIEAEYLIPMAPGINIVSKLSTYEGRQVHDHYDIAGEVPLHWKWEGEMPVYLVNKCPRKNPSEHWHVSRLLGPIMRPIPGVKKLHSAKLGMLIAEIDYMNYMYGIAGIYRVEPEPVQKAPLREAAL